jgi:hypothetical protein
MASNNEGISKYKGQCYNKGKWKYCYYWMAKHSKRNKAVIGFRCHLFDTDKEGRNSLPECDAQYGRTYDGRA